MTAREEKDQKAAKMQRQLSIKCFRCCFSVEFSVSAVSFWSVPLFSLLLPASASSLLNVPCFSAWNSTPHLDGITQLISTLVCLLTDTLNGCGSINSSHLNLCCINFHSHCLLLPSDLLCVFVVFHPVD